VIPAEIARRLGVSHQIVSEWRTVWRRFGCGYTAYTVVSLAIPIIGTKDFMGSGRYVLAAYPVMAAAAVVLTEDRRPRWLVVRRRHSVHGGVRCWATRRYWLATTTLEMSRMISPATFWSSKIMKSSNPMQHSGEIRGGIERRRPPDGIAPSFEDWPLAWLAAEPTS